MGKMKISDSAAEIFKCSPHVAWQGEDLLLLGHRTFPTGCLPKFPSLPPGSEPWGESRHLSTPCTSTHSMISFQAQPLAAIFIFLIPLPVPQPSTCSRQLCHLASIKPDGAWDRTGFSSQPCPRVDSHKSFRLYLFHTFLSQKKFNSLLESNIWDQSPNVANLGAKSLISFRQCWNTAVSFRVVRQKQAG